MASRKQKAPRPSPSSGSSISSSNQNTGSVTLVQANADDRLEPLSNYHFPNACKELSECRACRDNFRDKARYKQLLANGKAPLILYFLTYIARVPEAEALAAIGDLRKGIENRYQEICKEISTKGDKIMSRWCGFNTARRTQELQKALPEKFPDDEWAHLHAFFSRTPQSPVSSREKHRSKFLLPYLDPRDLAQDPSKLLQLMEMRRRDDPVRHAWNDHRTTAFGRESGMLAMRWANVMVSTQEHSYGQLVDFDHDSFHRWEMMSFPTAEILFTAQHRLYEFLGKIIEGILERATGEIIGCELWETEAKGAFGRCKRQAGKEGVGLFYIPVQHFQPLPTFDIHRLLDVMRERLEVAEEEFWLLQTDVVAAYDTVASIAQGTYFSKRDDNAWAVIAAELTQPLDDRAQLWSVIEVMGACVKQIHHQLSSGVSPNESQSAKDLDHAICHTHNLIYGMFELRYQGLIRRVLVTDSAFDRSFRGKSTLVREKSVTSRQLDQTTEVFTNQDFENDPLLWACVEMCNAWTSPCSPGAETALAYLDDVLASGAQKAGMDGFKNSRAEDIMVDLSSALWAMHHLETYRPRFQQMTVDERCETFEVFSARHCAIIKQRTDAGKAPYFKPEVKGGQFDYTHFVRAGRLLKKFHAVKFPSGRKRTVLWLEKPREAKMALDAFWEEARKVQISQLRVKQNEDSQQDVENCMDIKLLEYYRDPEFLDSVQAELDSIKEDKKAQETKRPVKRPSDDTYEPQSKFGTSPKSPSKRLKTEEPKKPAKKKRDPNYRGPREEQPEPVPLATLDPPIPDTIHVSSASLETFARLWPTQSKIGQGGFLRWNEFQAAMQDAGFRASTTGGSMFSFRSTYVTIVFHTPHGSGNVQVNNSILKKFGRRLTGHFGWTYDTFRDEEEEEVEEEEDDEDQG